MISIELSVDRSVLLDILVDGMDYVCRGYWAQIEDYRWKWWYTVDKVGDPTGTINPELTGDTVLCRIRDDSDICAEKKNRPFVDITLNKLEEAFGWTLTHYPNVISDLEIVDEVVTDCNQDADTQDVILQRIVLGEVVYG